MIDMFERKTEFIDRFAAAYMANRLGWIGHKVDFSDEADTARKYGGEAWEAWKKEVDNPSPSSS